MELESSEAYYKNMTTQKSDKPLQLAFIGDLFLGGEFISYAKKNNIDLLKPFERISRYLTNCDILFLNLEGPIFEGPNKRADVTSILSNHTIIIEWLISQKKPIINLSNNHIMDYGVEGLKHTISILKKHNLHFLGVGNNEEEANQELIVEVRGRRIGFLAYTSAEPHIGAIIAGHDKAGCASYRDIDKLIRKIESLKTNVDVICVSLHWGHEYFFYPSPEQVYTAHKMVDAGADYVIGHHPHVLQGIEHYNGSLIMYSLGNLFFPPIKSIYGRPHYQKEITKEYMIVKSEISMTKKIKWEIFGGKQNRQFVLNPYINNDLARLREKIEELSEPINGENYDKYWIDYSSKREKELSRENIMEAFKKIGMMSFKELLRTITLNDLKRNFNRLLKSIRHS